MSNTKKLTKNREILSDLLFLNIPKMLTMMDITKNVAPGKYQKLNPLSLYRLVNIVV
ncbi:hypothetical protein [Staphylococcus capitis]|uniref:hypothetical protein n=1 Tax=Staphylococcus capitis TaxID=29388 RepID=UPI00211E9E58|nr:hypothetical protein [Staphylococcus capitis]